MDYINYMHKYMMYASCRSCPHTAFLMTALCYVQHSYTRQKNHCVSSSHLSQLHCVLFNAPRFIQIYNINKGWGIYIYSMLEVIQFYCGFCGLHCIYFLMPSILLGWNSHFATGAWIMAKLLQQTSSCSIRTPLLTSEVHTMGGGG